MPTSKQDKLRARYVIGATLIRRILDGLCAGRSDYRAHQYRKASMGYRKKRGLCIWVWMGAGLSMIWQPQIQFVLLMGLLATFLSFALLDES